MDGWMNQAYSRLSTTHGHITDYKLVCMYWTRLLLVRPVASLYSASPLKHHPTGKQWCPNPDHYSDSDPARRSLTLLCWALSRVAEPQILTSFVLTRPGIEPPTSRMPGERSTTILPGHGTLSMEPQVDHVWCASYYLRNIAQPLQYPAAVRNTMDLCNITLL